MFDIQVKFEDVSISSVEKEDIIVIQKWMYEQESREEKLLSKPLDIEEFLERFLEYYMSENEFFLKIKQTDELIGIFKGRVEFKNPNEVMIWCYMLDNNFRGVGMGSKVLEKILEYFRDKLGIMTFSTGIMDGDSRVIKFWNKNRFSLTRISKDFFDIDGQLMDMLIFKRVDGK